MNSDDNIRFLRLKCSLDAVVIATMKLFGHAHPDGEKKGVNCFNLTIKNK